MSAPVTLGELRPCSPAFQLAGAEAGVSGGDLAGERGAGMPPPGMGTGRDAADGGAPPNNAASPAGSASPLEVDPAVGLPVEFKPKKKKKKKRKPLGFQDVYSLTGVVLGKGAASVVEECKEISSEKIFAVKIIDKHDYTVNRTNVFRELDILTECKGHDNILQLRKFFESDMLFHFVFEKCVGGMLLTHIQDRHNFTEREASLVTKDLASALVFIHDIGVAHRDLKPQNVLCVRTDCASPAKICDFNLGSDKLEKGKTPPLMTPVGTPEFMAPEVAEAVTAGEQRIYDSRCDIWSLGIILYIMLCGYPPFSADCGTDCGWKRGRGCEYCAETLLESIQEGHFDFPKKEWSRVSGAAKDLITRMLVRESQRISAADILHHPWVRQKAPSTPLLTPDTLRDNVKVVDQLSTLTEKANENNRLVDTMDAGFRLGSPGDSRLAKRRSQSQFEVMAQPFEALQNVDLEDIHTPRFGGLEIPASHNSRKAKRKHKKSPLGTF